MSNDPLPILVHPENELDDGRHRFDIQNPNASEICKAIELARAVDPSKCFTCSKDKLGHGYPAHTVKYEVLKTFPTKDALEKWLLENQQRHSKENVLAIYGLKTLQRRTQVTVEVLEGA